MLIIAPSGGKEQGTSQKLRNAGPYPSDKAPLCFFSVCRPRDLACFLSVRRPCFHPLQWELDAEEAVLLMMIIMTIMVTIASSTEAVSIAEAPRLSSPDREACTI